MVRIAIADDHVLVREGLRRLLSEQHDIEIVGEAADGFAAVELVRRQRPDVLLLDITMPGKDGLEATKEISALGEDTKILILTMHPEEQYALRTLRAGARGFIVKNAKPTELLEAIRQVHQGRHYLPPELEHIFAEHYVLPGDRKQPLERLSEREFQVLRLLAAGLSNREIAARLHITIKTVESHRSHLLKKLHLRNNSDLTRFALQYELIE